MMVNLNSDEESMLLTIAMSPRRMEEVLPYVSSLQFDSIFDNDNRHDTAESLKKFGLLQVLRREEVLPKGLSKLELEARGICVLTPKGLLYIARNFGNWLLETRVEE